ncbi:MAG: hypothetical protein HYW49_00070 [Deltaproteobacteria bacterium]|nr:hypothetical protein [Deltaproteobacteria bacterium]
MPLLRSLRNLLGLALILTFCSAAQAQEMVHVGAGEPTLPLDLRGKILEDRRTGDELLLLCTHADDQGICRRMRFALETREGQDEWIGPEYDFDDIHHFSQDASGVLPRQEREELPRFFSVTEKTVHLIAKHEVAGMMGFWIVGGAGMCVFNVGSALFFTAPAIVLGADVAKAPFVYGGIGLKRLVQHLALRMKERQIERGLQDILAKQWNRVVPRRIPHRRFQRIVEAIRAS